MNAIAESTSSSAVETPRFGLAWTAYIKPTVYLGIWLAMAWIFQNFGITFAVVFAGVGVLRYIVAVWWRITASVHVDPDGVWLVSGIFPWSRGVYGVRWREIGIAVFHQGFFSWIFDAYTIHVQNRFDVTRGLLMEHVHHGDEFVSHINAVLADRDRV